MTIPSGYGSVLCSVSDVFKEKPPKTVILFIIDGCRSDVFNSVLDNGGMPKLQRLMNVMGYERYKNCITAFPSVTLTAHTSILTGAWPGTHGIVGNEWFIRKLWGLHPDSHSTMRREFSDATREYVKLSFDIDDPGLLNLTGGYFKIADSDLYDTETIYESFSKNMDGDDEKPYTASIYEMITRGAEEKKTLFIDDLKATLKGRIVTWLHALRKLITGKKYLSVDNKGLDSRAFEELIEHCRQTENRGMRLFTVWLPGMDGFSHYNGARHQKEYFKKGGVIERLFLKYMDHGFGKLHDYLEQNDQLDQTLVVITADHGQYDCNVQMQYSNEYLYRQIQGCGALTSGETLPLTQDGRVDTTCKDATIIIIGNGGACYVYVKGEEGWRKLPGRNRLAKWVTYFEQHEAVDKIFVRSDDGMSFSWWKDGGFHMVSDLDQQEYPFAEERIASLGCTMRSGDILLTAKPGYYFAHSSMKGEHGSLRGEDCRVPLIFISRQFTKKQNVVTAVRTIDIMPTIIAAVHRPFHYETVRKIQEKLTALLDTLETYTVMQGKKHRQQKLSGAEIEKMYTAEINDIKLNFKSKLSYYHQNGTISDTERQTFQEQYRMILSGNVKG